MGNRSGDTIGGEVTTYTDPIKKRERREKMAKAKPRNITIQEFHNRIVVRIHNIAVGYCSFTPKTGGQIKIREMFVETPHRRNGYGTLMFSYLAFQKNDIIFDTKNTTDDWAHFVSSIITNTSNIY